jgi:two-component system cell cycle response regulator
MPFRDSLISIVPVAPGGVLVVDDDEHVRLDVVRSLTNLAIMAEQARNGVDALDVAQEKAGALDCILLDLSLPDIDGWEVLRRLHTDAETKSIPVLVLTDRAPTDAELVAIVEAGAIDHMVKPLSAPVLCAKVRAICDRSREQRELRNRLRHALENAAHDALTGMFNRRYFERRLREESAHARRHKRPFSLLMIDLDHFKLINDTYGHEDGDRVLVHMAEVIHGGIREDDIACRFGGEEFVVLLRATDGMAARVVANRLRTALAAKPLVLGESREPKHVTFSCGIAASDERNGFKTDDVLGRADAALYRAKRGGRNRVESD